jgi:4-hydroxybenzoate polyprenyltransferase
VFAAGVTLLSGSRLGGALADIKLAHSVFALPFAFLGAFLARDTRLDGTIPSGRSAPSVFLAQLALIVLCMVLARTFAMLVNRLADASIDARNPRTARRAFASGRLSVRDGLRYTIGAGIGFVGVTALFLALFSNPWPLALSVPVLAWLGAYSFTKRYTALCHIFLGVALALSPLAAAIAVNPHELRFHIGAAGSARTGCLVPGILMALFITAWAGGFDIIYALQDRDVDRRERLHSIPARLGVRGALWTSRALHVAAFALLVLFARSEPRLGLAFAGAVAIVGVLLIAEHVVLALRGQAGLDVAFFTLNGIVSCVVGVLGCADLSAG